jgi:hypothetical protein
MGNFERQKDRAISALPFVLSHLPDVFLFGPIPSAHFDRTDLCGPRIDRDDG